MGKISSTGALSVNTGKFTGRSPKDRFIVKDETTKDDVWWGDINIPFNSSNFDRLHEKMVKYLEYKEIYVRDVYACSLEKFKLNIRVINEYPWSNHFVSNMFNDLEEKDIKSFIPEWNIINVPSFEANQKLMAPDNLIFQLLISQKK